MLEGDKCHGKMTRPRGIGGTGRGQIGLPEKVASEQRRRERRKRQVQGAGG